MIGPHFLMCVKDFPRKGGGVVQLEMFFFSNNFFHPVCNVKKI